MHREILFYFDQLADASAIRGGGVGVFLRSLMRTLSSSAPTATFLFVGDAVTQQSTIGCTTTIPTSGLTQARAQQSETIVVIDRIGALRPIWSSLSHSRRVLNLHSWEVQEDPEHFTDFVCQSADHKSWLISQGISGSRIHVIGLAVDFNEFEITDNQIDRPPNSILCVGAIIEHKGAHLVAEAAQILKVKFPELQLTLAGAASLWSQSDGYEKALKGSSPSWISFLGAVPRHSLSHLYQSHSIIASASKLETAGLAAIEAQGFGCIPVSLAVGGVGITMQEGRTGRLYYERSSAALAAAIHTTLQEIDIGTISRSHAIKHAHTAYDPLTQTKEWLKFLRVEEETISVLGPQTGFSFCIRTNGARPDKLARLINSIHRQQLAQYEIIVAGLVPPGLKDVIAINLEDEAKSGNIALLRNRAMTTALYPIIVALDDDLVLDDGFASAIAHYKNPFDILCVAVRNPDGSRYWDWATHGGPTGHRLLDYDEYDPHVYASGAVLVITKEALNFGLLDESRGFYQAEDVEFSHRMSSAGARFAFCKDATLLHDDPRYTQWDDYSVRIFDATSWESIGEGVKARGLYPWDGNTFPLSHTVDIELSNNQATPISYSFTLLPNTHESTTWGCSIYSGAELLVKVYVPTNIAFVVAPNTTNIVTLECSDVVVAFTHGHFRDQRAIGGSISRPTKRAPKSGDFALSPTLTGKCELGFNQPGIAIFAPCMAFGLFASQCRELVHTFESWGLPFGLELHSVDHWFSQITMGFESSRLTWSRRLKLRRSTGINLVCADASKHSPSFFNQARTSRPGYRTHIAFTTATNDPDTLAALRLYDAILVNSQQDVGIMRSHGVKVGHFSFAASSPKGNLAISRRLPQQRSRATTILIDDSSHLEPALSSFANQYRATDDVSLIIYVVADKPTLENVIGRIESFYRQTGIDNRIEQTIVTTGPLEALEELEFLKGSNELINLLNPPMAQRIQTLIGGMR